MQTQGRFSCLIRKAKYILRGDGFSKLVEEIRKDNEDNIKIHEA